MNHRRGRFTGPMARASEHIDKGLDTDFVHSVPFRDARSKIVQPR